ncbi:MAG: DUF362 domain-containing protein [Puniceicoccales bacterium]|jgi:uncharacterized Fe-S center protein|nr:DUF362 domain-containing protein [Puniceicoccales bacterium]
MKQTSRDAGAGAASIPEKPARSKVYHTDMRTRAGLGLLEKLDRLVRRAGIGDIDFTGRFAAIKIHFGELGNLASLRPNYARCVAGIVAGLGAKPFLTDCGTLYAGHRKNALDHLDCAMKNGFSPMSTGCQIIIGDGLKGTDEALVPVTGTEFVSVAKIGRAIMDADIIISLNHFKGHELTGFGGALKNLGMGCASRAGKMEQHNSGKPVVRPRLCRKCRACAKECGQDAIDYGDDGTARIHPGRCAGCGRCIGTCNFDAIENPDWNPNEILCKKMAEYALAVTQGRPQFHINIATQISPCCDCHGENDMPFIPDCGMLASFDPVALDQATADICNGQTPIAGGALEQTLKHGPAPGGECACGMCHDGGGHDGDAHARHADHFTTLFPDTNWRATLDHAEKIGVGTRDYELMRV